MAIQFIHRSLNMYCRSICTGRILVSNRRYLRYPRFQRLMMYDTCQLDQSTHFFILNYDGQYTLVERTQQIYHPSENESYEVIGFVNRYMKYVILNGIVRAVDYQYRRRIANILKNPKQGLDNAEVQRLRECHGTGTMII